MAELVVLSYEGNLYVKPDFGFVALEPYGSYAYLHVIWLADKRGKPAIDFVRETIRHIFKTTSFQRLRARFCVYRRDVAFFCHWCGLKRVQAGLYQIERTSLCHS